jgi:hypothetical protein
MRGCSHRPNTSSDYATLAGDLEVRLSTGRTGQCWDNALAGSFFASLKGECLDLQLWPTRARARRATVDYIAWYNGARLHSALGYQTPDQYESITPRRSLLRQPDRAIGPVRQTGATPCLWEQLAMACLRPLGWRPGADHHPHGSAGARGDCQDLRGSAPGRGGTARAGGPTLGRAAVMDRCPTNSHPADTRARQQLIVISSGSPSSRSPGPAGRTCCRPGR